MPNAIKNIAKHKQLSVIISFVYIVISILLFNCYYYVLNIG